MAKSHIIAALALVLAGTGALAQDQVVEADANAQQAGTTWYALIAIRQNPGPEGCNSYIYKVSTVEPIMFEGPRDFTSAHADELVASWMMYLHDRSPTAYRWINGPAGYESPKVYVRESADEVMQAFREDGHLVRDRRCPGSVLLTHGTSKFRFDPPVDFAEASFGSTPRPDPAEGLVVRELAKIPGLD